jgi:hypothetical protein
LSALRDPIVTSWPSAASFDAIARPCDSDQVFHFHGQGTVACGVRRVEQVDEVSPQLRPTLAKLSLGHHERPELLLVERDEPVRAVVRYRDGLALELGLHPVRLEHLAHVLLRAP